MCRNAGWPVLQIRERKMASWVTDFSRQRQWPTTQANAGHQRDFYRTRMTDDPVVVEKIYSDLESKICPILKALDRERREPNRDELDALLQFMAIQKSRVPAFRAAGLKIFEAFAHKEMAELLRTPETWLAELERLDIPSDIPGVDYASMKAFAKARVYRFVPETDWYIELGFDEAENVVSELRKRRWTTSFSPQGRFIASDDPVAMDGPKGKQITFATATAIFYPVSRHVFLHGTSVPISPPDTFKFIAHLNTLMLLTADRQVYSHMPDFSWLDEKRGHQTDWQLFVKERFLARALL
jgi:hypothetical protein